MSTPVLSDQIPLRPARRWWLRFVVFAVVASPALFSRVEWHKKFIFAATMAGCWQLSDRANSTRAFRASHVRHVFAGPHETLVA